MRLPLYLFLLPITPTSTTAGSVPQGGPCTPSTNHLDPATHKLLSECNDATFCSAATCIPRLCRRDEFPFRTDPAASTPPLCDPGSFCPDEGSGCKPLGPPGSPCQLNRDEQCAPPPSGKQWDASDASSPSPGVNFNGSICLRSICMYANATLGHPCITQDTTYLEFLGEGRTFNHTISRHNCRPPGLYCDSASNSTCRSTKPVGVACAFDVECLTRNCDDAACAKPPGLPVAVAPWEWTVIAISISSFLIALLSALTFLRRRTIQRNERDSRDYYIEQLSLRRSIIQLHTTAAEGFPLEKY